MAEANHFVLAGAGIHVVVDLSGLNGEPILELHDSLGLRTYTGSQLHVDDTVIGTLLTATTGPDGDAGGTYFSVLVPRVASSGGTAHVTTYGFDSRRRTNRLPWTGQLDSYTTKSLVGTASIVQS